MIYALLLVSCALCYLIYAHKRALEVKTNNAGAHYALATNAFELLVPFTAVTFLYSILAYSLNDMGSDEVTMEALRNYEKRIQEVNGWLAYIKLKPVLSFLLIVLWFATAMIVRIHINPNASQRLEQAYLKYETYDKWLKRVSTVVLLLTSFTFFDGKVTEFDRELQVHIKSLEESHEAFADNVAKAVEATVLDGIYKQIDSSAPPTYVKLKELSSEALIRCREALEIYNKTKTDYKYESPRLHEIVNDLQHREEGIVVSNDKAGHLRQQTTELEPSLKHAASKLSQFDLIGLKNLSRVHQQTFWEDGEPVLQTLLGNKITPSALGVLITHKNIAALNYLAADFPILEAILPVFSKALSKHIEMQINLAAERIVQNTMMERSRNANNKVYTEAGKIVQEAVIDWSAVAPGTFAAIEAALRADNLTISTASDEVNSRLAEQRNRVAIENLALAPKVQGLWKEVMIREKESVRNILGGKARKPSPEELDQAFQEFALRIMSISEPVKQQGMLRNTLRAMSVEIKLDKNGLPVKNHLDEVVSRLIELESSRFSIPEVYLSKKPTFAALREKYNDESSSSTEPPASYRPKPYRPEPYRPRPRPVPHP